jgi:hypothetical protein
MHNNKAILSFFIILLFGCQQQVTSHPETDSSSNNKAEKSVNLPYQGTIRYFEQEGGFFGIITDKGQKLLPDNLDKIYHQDGAVIEFSGEIKNVMTIQMWGKPFTINDIKLISPGKNNSTKSEI